MEKNFNVRTTENGMFLVEYYESSQTPDVCGSNHTYAFADLASALSFIESKFVPEAPAQEAPQA